VLAELTGLEPAGIDCFLGIDPAHPRASSEEKKKRDPLAGGFFSDRLLFLPA
jgi:hypothetical protein